MTRRRERQTQKVLRALLSPEFNAFRRYTVGSVVAGNAQQQTGGGGAGGVARIVLICGIPAIPAGLDIRAFYVFYADHLVARAGAYAYEAVWPGCLVSSHRN